MTNIGVIFKRALWDSRIGILSWGIGLGLVALMEILMFPSISRAFAGLADLLESPFYRAFLGESADAGSFATPEGYIAIYMLAFVPLYLAVYMVMLGLGIVSNDEDSGRLDVLLGTPVPRWQIIVEKFAALVVILLLVLVLNSALAAVGVFLTAEMQTLPLSRLVDATLAMLPVTLVMAAMTLFFSTVLRSRTLAIGLTGAIIIGSYLVNNLAPIAQEALGTLKYVSFFHYFSPLGTMRTGMDWGDFLITLAIALVLFGLSLLAFQRRDLGV
jgi:ABC-2 type transport system permease protein